MNLEIVFLILAYVFSGGFIVAGIYLLKLAIEKNTASRSSLFRGRILLTIFWFLFWLVPYQLLGFKTDFAWTANNADLIVPCIMIGFLFVPIGMFSCMGAFRDAMKSGITIMFVPSILFYVIVYIPLIADTGYKYILVSASIGVLLGSVIYFFNADEINEEDKKTLLKESLSKPDGSNA